VVRPDQQESPMSATVVPSAVLAAVDPGLSDTGVSGIPTMLVIAGIALVLGILALWLARRRKHRDGL